MKYIITPTKFSVHHAGDNPIFGDSVTTIELMDEAAGVFLEITNLHDGNSIRLDIDELNFITEHVNKIKEQYDTLS
jgi:hypothetical protein